MADQAPPEDVQESNSGRTAGVDSTSSVGSAPEFPDRLRVHALAKLLGITSKQVLATLAELGVAAKSVQSSLGRDVAEAVHASINKPSEPVPALADTPSAEPTAAADTPVEVQEEAGLFTAPAAPETAPFVATSAAMPLFLQPEAPAEPAPRRRRARKAAAPATPTPDATAEAPESAPAGDDLVVDAAGSADAVRADAVRADAVRADAVPADAGAGVVADASAADSTATVAQADAGTSVDTTDSSTETSSDEDSSESDDNDDQSQPRRRRRGRRGRGRGRGEQSSDGGDDDDADDSSDSADGADARASDPTASNVDAGGAKSVDSGDSDAVGGREADDKSDGMSDDADSGAEDNQDTDAESPGDKPSTGRRRRRTRTRSSDRSDDDTADKSASSDENSDDDSSGDGQNNTESADAGDDQDDDNDGSSRRRRRRRRRKSTGDASADGAESEDDPPNTVVHEREPRNKSRAGRDEVQGITGSTRLEAKRQRRRDGRDAGRRRPPILTESEFLARRESVDRVMVVREKELPEHGLTTQVAVLEDGVLVEHFVTSSASASMVGNVYLGRVQNVLPSMEAAFIDIGRGRNGVLYAGEVNWDAAGLGGNSRKIEQALKPGDQVLVQVSKDPVGHKGARLTTQLSLAGRFLVYVPGGSSTGISRKLPDTERKRLKEILRDIVPPEAGVIIRTAAEGVSEEELARDVARLQAQWAGIEEASANAETGKGSQPQALYEEPDLLVKVIRDLFNEDFVKLVIEGEKAWTTTSGYIETVAADMMNRLERFEAQPGKPDVFAAHRIDEQLAKALDRKVWLPSGGTLVIDRTEAMTVVDVNTGKFTGAGGNLEETVTRNNLEAAEEVVRQMRLRDIGGMIVVDFIDMVLESNRDLVLRRLTEALGRDRTRHQVSEVTSLGLVQMTRKKLGTGLVEAFSTTCEHCQGRGIIVHPFPVESKPVEDGNRGGSSRSESAGGPRKRRGRGDKAEVAAPNPVEQTQPEQPGVDPSIKRAHPVALAMAAHHDDVVTDVVPADVTGRDPEATTVVATVETADAARGESLAETTVQPAEVETAAAVATSTAGESVAVSQDDAVTVEPVVKARRGRRVARKAAAPAASVSDAGTVIVVPTPHEEPRSDAQEPVPPPVLPDPPSPDAAPVARPRRRRAAARPAGPPVDADV